MQRRPPASLVSGDISDATGGLVQCGYSWQEGVVGVKNKKQTSFDSKQKVLVGGFWSISGCDSTWNHLQNFFFLLSLGE